MTATVGGRPGPGPGSGIGSGEGTWTGPPPRRGSGGLLGTGALIRLALRRDRILLPAAIAVLAATVVTSVSATRGLYPTEESLSGAAATINATAALVALYGKIYVTTSLGAVSLIKMTSFGAALVAILFVVLVVRHSRAEEETGRLELVSAGVVGRAAPLTAALVVGTGSSVVLGLVTALACWAGGLAWSGSIAFGLGWALSGIVFSAIAGVAAQVTTSARAAIGIGTAAVGASYALRAVGDLAAGDPGWASWLSPIGWSQQIRPFAGDRWWVAGVPLAASAVLVPAAYLLRSRRDLGSGLVADRPGPAVGNLRGVLGLAWHLQRGMLVAWVVGASLLGAVLGSVAHNVSGMLTSPQMRELFEVLGGEQGLTDAFLAAEVGIVAAFVTAYGIAAASRLRAEEVAGHAELLLAMGASRARWAASHGGLALVGTAMILLAAGMGIGLGHGIATGDPLGQVGRMVGAAAAQIPATWVVVSIVLALFGWLPLGVPAAWGVLVGFVLVGEFGALWSIPQAVLDLSPFAHSPRLPGGVLDLGDLLGLLAVAAALVGLAWAGWRRRDLQG